MGKYQIIEIRRNNHQIKVVIEDENGHNETWGYPLGSGYGEIDINGELRAVTATLRKLREREEQAAKYAADAIDIEAENAKNKNRVFGFVDHEVTQGRKKVIELDKDGKKIKDIKA